LGKVKVKIKYKSERDSSEVWGQGVGLTDHWLQLVRCAVLVVTKVQFTGGLDIESRQETRGREFEGQEFRVGVNEIFELPFQQLVRGYIQESAIVDANMVMNKRSELRTISRGYN
jgi:hypothetical protein